MSTQHVASVRGSDSPHVKQTMWKLTLPDSTRSVTPFFIIHHLKKHKQMVERLKMVELCLRTENLCKLIKV